MEIASTARAEAISLPRGEEDHIRAKIAWRVGSSTKAASIPVRVISSITASLKPKASAASFVLALQRRMKERRVVRN